MTTDLISRARAGDGEAFRALTEPYRRELQVHCYRMLGSLQDAEDALQDTLLAAWQGLGGFEGRASIRTWLYRIATNRCLNALRSANRRPAKEWDMPEVEPPDPEARYEQTEAISLAFVTALQVLPPRQLAVLILRDVLGFHANEVADMLDSTVESVNSALKRARASLQRRQPPTDEREPASAPDSTSEQALVAEFVRAYESGDLDALVALLTDDVHVSMPPIPLEYQGRDVVARLFASIFRFDSSVLPWFGLPRSLPKRLTRSSARNPGAAVKPIADEVASPVVGACDHNDPTRPPEVCVPPACTPNLPALPPTLATCCACCTAPTAWPAACSWSCSPSRAGRRPRSPTCSATTLGRCAAGFTATNATAPAHWPTGPEPADHGWAAPPSPSASCGSSSSQAPGPSHGCGSDWAAPPSPCGPCTAASLRSPPGGDPAWSPRATPTATRSSPTCTATSVACPQVRWCWPRTRPTSTCCPGSARPGSPGGSASRS